MQNPELIETIARSDIFQKYEAAFTELTGLPIALRAAGSHKLPFRGKSAENHFCALMASNSATCAACLLAQETLQQQASRGAAIISCRHGLREVAIPITVGTEAIAFLRTGQMAERVPGPAEIATLEAELKELGIAAPQQTIAEAFRKTPVLDSKRTQAVVDLLNTFAEMLTDRVNRILTMDAHREPLLVTKAKHYVREHAGNELSLRVVAQAVNTSTFHLCKLFKASTGTHFTEYISRVRVEKARTLLLDESLRISEVAYRAGFQSLTHFNRMFRRITGTSPTLYRQQLHRWRARLRHSEAGSQPGKGPQYTPV